MSLHKLSAGSGYTYLSRQVAAGDVTARGHGSLGAYYEQRGESPGVWLGGGLASLGGGPRAGDPVSEAQMLALFGRGHHPGAATLAGVAGQPAGGPGSVQLGAPYVTIGPRVSVAGYDLTFSPVKSVSAMWALADSDIAAQVEAAHTSAFTDTIGWLERTAVYTRLGAGGLRQVDVTGLLAVAFTHRDSRNGDPDLHTHVAISNKVRTLDSRWRALDGRALHAAAVAASERYNTRLEAQLVQRLGVTFTDRPTRPGLRPVRELVGVPAELLAAWSTRRAQITTGHAQLLDRFQATYGREPTTAEGHALAQQATLATRPAKQGPRSEAEQRRTWRTQADHVLGADTAGNVPDQVVHQQPAASHLDPGWAVRAAGTAVGTVSAQRAVFTSHHLRAELERLARTDRIPLHALDTAIDEALTVAVSADLSLRLDREPDRDRLLADMDVLEPAGLRRRDGSSVYATAHTQLFTTPELLAAEQRILASAEHTDGHWIPAGLIELALLESRLAGRPLNAGQQAMVRELATSGRRVQVAIAPAGTGKTTALGILAAAWTDAGGTVLGAAPSAVAANELRKATGHLAVTLASALRTIDASRDGVGEVAWIAGVPLGPQVLVVVDEAGMAATTDLAGLIDAVTDAGGSVRLVGDTAQLSSPAAGGILHDLVRAHGGVELDTPVRFTDPKEAQATLAIRAGEPDGLAFYAERGRIHIPANTLGTEQSVPEAAERADPERGAFGDAVDSALAGWAADRAAGQDSMLLAGSNTLVAELNARARAARLAGTADTGQPEVGLRDGTAASVGDVVLARHNQRDLPITATEWVKNGDRFTVTGLTGDGGLRVRHAPTRRQLTLPAAYVTEHLQLGYAATIHLAQGATVDTTHALLTGTENREQLYVALSRGRSANHLYLSPGPVDNEDPAHPALTFARQTNNAPRDPLELLRGVLDRTDQRPSATSTLTDAADPGRQLHAAVERYLDAHALAKGQGSRPNEQAASGGPLPWLPPPPEPDPGAPDRGELAEYVQQRADLVHSLAATITADHLPDTVWADQLRQSDPGLARRLAVWRAATGATDHLYPVGPTTPLHPRCAPSSRYSSPPTCPATATISTEGWTTDLSSPGLSNAFARHPLATAQPAAPADEPGDHDVAASPPASPTSRTD
ncbi:MobF family relaxase [Modestobacter sp. DSM 44400]|uniref:MobF family relaxase n=1 Tax=Modestobacter sp. DSM 44400 TaxID=1550230 RepID=UPI000B83D0EE|nr:MobF family relaxase [Modestobacter sp. DSM 44400]